jgi:predicted nucleotidyltransferase
MTKEQLLDELVTNLTAGLGDDLISIVLYGSAVTGDFQEKVSDLNVLCVLKNVGPAQLEKAYPAVDRWMKKKQPAPVLLSLEEVENAHDAFAIEFLDIRAAYRVLHGDDVVAQISVDPPHHRHQVEHELRSMLLRLRERFLALQKDHREVTRLMVDSVPTFSTLFRHSLILSGEEPPVKKREIFRQAAQRFSTSATPFETLLDVREGKRRLKDPEIRPLFEDYLAQITRTAEDVDRL